jgi:hypothetical protein
MGQEHRHTVVPNHPAPRPERARRLRRPVPRRVATLAVGLTAVLSPVVLAGCGGGGDDASSTTQAPTTTAPPDTAPVLKPPTVSPTVLPANAEFCGKMAELITRVIEPKEGETDFRGPWLEVAKFSPEVLRADMEGAVSENPGVDVEGAVARIDKWLATNCGFTIAESTGSTPLEVPEDTTTTTTAK